MLTVCKKRIYDESGNAICLLRENSDDDILYLIMSADNWKEMWVMVRMGITKRKKKKLPSNNSCMNRKWNWKMHVRQTALALNQGKVEGKNQNIRTQAAGESDDR